MRRNTSAVAAGGDGGRCSVCNTKLQWCICATKRAAEIVQQGSAGAAAAALAAVMEAPPAAAGTETDPGGGSGGAVVESAGPTEEQKQDGVAAAAGSGAGGNSAVPDFDPDGDGDQESYFVAETTDATARAPKEVTAADFNPDADDAGETYFVASVQDVAAAAAMSGTSGSAESESPYAVASSGGPVSASTTARGEGAGSDDKASATYEMAAATAQPGGGTFEAADAAYHLAGASGDASYTLASASPIGGGSGDAGSGGGGGDDASYSLASATGGDGMMEVTNDDDNLSDEEADDGPNAYQLASATKLPAAPTGGDDDVASYALASATPQPASATGASVDADADADADEQASYSLATPSSPPFAPASPPESSADSQPATLLMEVENDEDLSDCDSDGSGEYDVASSKPAWKLAAAAALARKTIEAELASDPDHQRREAAAAAEKVAAEERRISAQREANSKIVRSSSKRVDEWVPQSQRRDSGAAGPALTDIASTFDATRAKPKPLKKVAKVPKVRAAQTLGTSSVFMVQQSTMLAEEAHLERLGDGETDKVHPSQLESEEALPELVPKWRLKQIEELDAERNDTSDLSQVLLHTRLFIPVIQIVGSFGSRLGCAWGGAAIPTPSIACVYPTICTSCVVCGVWCVVCGVWCSLFAVCMRSVC